MTMEREMSHKVETMAYANEKPWHGLGFQVSNKLSVEQMLAAAKIDWTVSKQKLYLNGEHDNRLVDGTYALMRDTDKSVLSIVGEVYKPVQNAESMDFFQKFVEAGKMNMETAGSLWGGRYVWGLARVGKDIKILGKDEIRGYLLLSSPHVHGKSMVIQFTPIRVVCWNTIRMALGEKLKGNGSAFRMPHSTKFDESVKQKAAEALGLATKQMEEFGEVASHLAKKKAKAEDVEQYFCDVLRFDPKKAMAEGKVKKDKEVKEPRMLPHLRAALEHAPGHDMVTAAGTWWGALNAVTYVVDHETSGNRDTALKNAWFGHKAEIKSRALDLVMAAAKVS